MCAHDHGGECRHHRAPRQRATDVFGACLPGTASPDSTTDRLTVSLCCKAPLACPHSRSGPSRFLPRASSDAFPTSPCPSFLSVLRSLVILPLPHPPFFLFSTLAA